LEEIRRYATGHGYMLPEKFIFADEGISGRSARKRPQFNRMIALAHQKPQPFQAILLWKFSRFARSREDSIVYKSLLRRELGIDVVSVSEPLSNDKTSLILEAMIEAMDEYYSMNLAEEVKRGMAQKARLGGLQSASPFGYAARGGILVPVPEEAILVQELFRRYADGMGQFQLAVWLNNLGARTHRGGRFESRTVSYILQNPVYIGKLRWNPTGRTRWNFQDPNIILADGKHEPLISPALWDIVQGRICAEGNRSPHARPMHDHRDWLSGLVRCADCGKTLVLTKPHYWKCNGYCHGVCKSTQHITDEKLKSLVLTRLVHDFRTLYKPVCQPLQPRDTTGIVQVQREQLARKLERLREAYLSGVENLDGYRRAKIELEQQIVHLEETSVPPMLPTRTADSCLDILRDPDFPMEQRYRLAHTIFQKIIFSRRDNLMVVYYFLS